jgi:hypothetical protein
MYVHLSFHLSLGGQCPGLVGIHAGDKNTLNDFKLIIIGFYFSFHLGFKPCRQFFISFTVVSPFAWVVLISSFISLDLRPSWFPSWPTFLDRRPFFSVGSDFSQEVCHHLLRFHSVAI